MSDNPLMNYARHVELAIKLPTNGNWYPDGMIDYNMNGEVEVYPMLPKDEIILYNPDLLMSGSAIVEIIKSCCPSIHNPEKLYYPDVEVLLLAIKKASMGSKHMIKSSCPYCEYKSKEAKDEKELQEMIDKNEINIHEQEYEFDIEQILESITYLEPSYTYESNGLVYSLAPHTLYEREKSEVTNFQNQKMLQTLQNELLKTDLDDETRNSITENIKSLYQEILLSTFKLAAKSIISINLPDGSYVDNQENIEEFILSSKTQVVDPLLEEIRKINAIGLPEKLTLECNCCNKEYDVPFYGFNQSAFFD